MILCQQVSSDLLNVASGTFYALICAYQVNQLAFEFTFENYCEERMKLIIFLDRISASRRRIVVSTRGGSLSESFG
jgi:hypothetical protein